MYEITWKISNEFKNKEPIIGSGTHRQQWHKIKINMCISATDTRTHELKVEYIKKRHFYHVKLNSMTSITIFSTTYR